MKKLFVMVIVLVFLMNISFINIIFANANENNIIEESNDISIYYEKQIYNYNNKYEFIFFNGLPLSNINIIDIDNDKFLPLRRISDYLNINLKWNNSNGIITMIVENNKIDFKNGDSYIIVNDKKSVFNGKSKLIDGTTYVNIEFIKNYLNCNVEYFTKNHKGKDLLYISIYNYDKSPISKAESTKILKNNLINAYEFKFGKFIPLLGGEIKEEGDKGDLRYYITNIEVISENSIYYIYKDYRLYYNFYVNKYTGNVYKIYSDNNYIFIEDFNIENALNFE